MSFKEALCKLDQLISRQNDYFGYFTDDVTHHDCAEERLELFSGCESQGLYCWHRLSPQDSSRHPRPNKRLLRSTPTIRSHYTQYFHPTAFCVPSDFSVPIVNLLFSLMDRQYHFLTPYDDLVQFVRLCGFFLVSEEFLFQHLALPVVIGSLPCAILPLIWECYQNGFLRLSSHLFFSPYGRHIPWHFHSAKSYRSLARENRSFSLVLSP